MTFQGNQIILRRSARAKRLSIKARPGAPGFEVTMPTWATEAQLASFLQSCAGWMAARRDLLLTWTPTCAAGERHLLFGSYVTLGEGDVPTGRAFLTWRQQQLEAYVTPILTRLCAQTGIQIQRVRYREVKSCWGNIRPQTGDMLLNTRLALVPKPCIEAVLLHELVHMHVPAHNQAFYREVTAWMPDYPARYERLSHFDTRPLPPLNAAEASKKPSD